MSVAACALNFGSLAIAEVRLQRYVLLGNRLVEAGPAGSRLKLGAGIEKRGLAANAQVQAVAVKIGVFPCKRPLRTRPPGDFELLGVQLLFPFRIGLLDLGHLDDAFGDARRVELGDLYGWIWF